MNKKEFIETIKNNLIVSCQAVGDEPLNNVVAITLMAKSVLDGGAKILRLSQKDHIASIKNIAKDIPIIGLIKNKYSNSEVFITPTIKEVQDLIELGVDCIALDATRRKRPCQTLEEIIFYIKKYYPNLAIMADCSSIDDVLNASQLGVDLIGSTLHGYTPETKSLSCISNNYDFIKKMTNCTKVPIIAEGGIWEPKQVQDLFQIGVHAVVVGSAITRPKNITERFLSFLNKKG